LTIEQHPSCQWHADKQNNEITSRTPSVEQLDGLFFFSHEIGKTKPFSVRQESRTNRQVRQQTQSFRMRKGGKARGVVIRGERQFFSETEGRTRRRVKNRQLTTDLIGILKWASR
jgi:hypothetical protein